MKKKKEYHVVVHWNVVYKTLLLSLSLLVCERNTKHSQPSQYTVNR